MPVFEATRLTTLAARAGCAAKMGPAALFAAVRPLAAQAYPAELLVGLQTSDDAAVYQLGPDLAIVLTIDFFTPIVDDSWTFGAIAAANSMSDVYAMGGEVLTALNVAGFPDSLPATDIAAIFAGALAKVAEAGAVISGGHTIVTEEPIFGLSVTGRVDPTRILTKAAAHPGDVLFFTKPIGIGVITTALKQGVCKPEHRDTAVESMLTLNMAASRAIRSVSSVIACTDVTGFGLLGHASEMATRSGVRLRIDAGEVPLLSGALEYAAAGNLPGGLHRNREFFSTHGGGVSFDSSLDPARQHLMFDPQTSGGLLFSAPLADRSKVHAAFAADNLSLWEIGAVETGAGIVVTN